MKNIKKISAKAKEQKLLEKIEKAKNDLNKLQRRLKLEVGQLAHKHGLTAIELPTLDKAFAKLAAELLSVSNKSMLYADATEQAHVCA